ncbi:ATP-binding cassette sub-family A member 3-like [Rhagoletis pomonella]|uniref:ATP-binding cassette sub-family A member 3-like n=1 Tax=Rhagoletis pomonella TaxID=28610 RepID=UPI001782E498|nr:ATP-binding cassette sub-family A member 3-like [Rhagoletis pomonella]
MVKICIVMVLFLLAAWWLLPPQHTSGFVLRWVASLILLAGAALISTNYFLSQFFTSNYRAYLVITSLQSLGIASFIIFPNVLKDLSSTATLPLRIFPLFSFCNGVYNVYKYNEKLNFCNNKIITTLCIAMEECKHIIGNCENKKLQVEEDAKYLYVITALSWLGIMIYECRHFFTHVVPFDNSERALDEHKRRHASEPTEVDSVTAEAIKVQAMEPRMRNYYTVICEQLGLIQKGQILVDRLTFTIQPGETFGIIGTNCKCTDALLNLLAGEQRPSFGRGYVNTVSLVDERRKALAHIGYVPTINCVMPEMTCYQILKMFCILYAYPYKEIDDICENLSEHFGFYSHYNVRLDHCSMGIRERISNSIAILMKPAFLCIGSYSWCLDPHGRRQLYRLLNELCKQGTAVTMTSVVNCFTEILCTKIVVMQHGQILHIGKPSQIASAIAHGYFVTMRMRKVVQTPQGLSSKVYFRLTSFMEKNFPSSILVEEGTLMQFFIPHYSTTLATLFKIIRLNSFQLNIESVSIASINMNYVFGLITERAKRSIMT